MDMSFIENKPSDWPVNNIECQLDNIQEALNIFVKEPNYKNKEVLISLVTSYDLNQMNRYGLIRTTDYEVAMINSLFLNATIHQIYALKVFLYDLITYKTRTQKMASWIPEAKMSIEIKEFEYLLPELQLHHVAYQLHNYYKDKSYVDYLIKIVEDAILQNADKEEVSKKEYISDITHAYISLINDISNFRCKKTTEVFAFNRTEIYRVYKLAAKLIKLDGDNPVKRPLKGTLMMSISNFVLKSRNNYNNDYIYKYVSEEVAIASVSNHQIWMQSIEKLNDEREQKIIPELFKDNDWIKYKWVREIDFTPKRIYYVSSFSKVKNDTYMKENYGNCIYGYKDDRVSDLLSPIMYRGSTDGKKIPMLSQVIAFDVLYDNYEAKKELKFLFKIINLFKMDDDSKKKFLEDILQYWILSVKDYKWKQEQERRYVIFMYEGYEYKEVDVSNKNILKLKTSVFIEPDFILEKNPSKDYIRKMVDNKRLSIYSREYLFCHNCLNRDFDIVMSYKKIKCCPICESKNIEFINYKINVNE